MSNDKLAIAIFSFNRPEYLRQVISSIERNSEIADADFYFFQDGAINAFSGRTAAKGEDIQECLNIWNQCALPNKHLFHNEKNVGIAITQFRAKVILFEEKKHEKAIFFEDDLIVSKDYVRLLRLMLEQFRGEENVGAVMCHGGHPKVRPPEERNTLLKKVHSGNHNLWGWGTWRDRWDRIKPTFSKYYEMVRFIDYRQRPAEEIMSLYAREGIKTEVTSQDAALHYALIKNDLVALNTIIHRGRYIGESGEHMNPHNYKRIGFSKIRVEDFPDDTDTTCLEGYDAEKALQFSKSLFLTLADPS